MIFSLRDFPAIALPGSNLHHISRLAAFRLRSSICPRFEKFWIPNVYFFIFYIYMLACFMAKFLKLKAKLPVIYYFIE